MRGNVLELRQTVQIITEECCSCGVLFGLTNSFKKERVKDHAQWFCPNGHSQSYVGESDAERNARLLREEQERHKRTLARENEAIAKASAEKARADRIEKRLKHGVCPCCQRTFKQLAAHMKNKHPQYAGAKP